MSEGLIRFDGILDIANERHLCVPMLDWGFGRPEFAEGMLAACKAADSVAVFLAWAGSGRRYGFRTLVELLGHLAGEAGVPAALHLDHANDEADVRAAIDAGFSSVMFDGAGLPYHENVARTRSITAHAHSKGVLLEGALGGMGREGGAGAEESPTDPDEAAEFARETGADIVAPSVGNRHGMRSGTVPLDWDLIARLHEKVSAPLALHGGSGCALADVRRAAGFGFRKLNLVTRLQVAYDEAFVAACSGGDGGWYAWAKAGRAVIEEKVAEVLDALDMAGTASALR